MKKIYIYLFSMLAMITMAGCSGDLASEGLTSVDDYPKVIMNGDKFTISPIGQQYQDAGASVTFQGQDYTSKMVTSGLSDIDINKANLYYVTYSATGPNGYKWSEKRTVAVCDPSVTTDLAGTWTVQPASNRTDNNGETFTGCTVTIKYLCPGVFKISDYLAGYYQQHIYGPDYASYNLSFSGIFSLTKDNKLEMITSDPATSFTGSPKCTSFVGSYDPDTQTITYDAVARAHTFHVVLKQ